MLTVILAAGRGERFAKAGYDVPKPILPAKHGGTVLETIVKNLEPRFLYMVFNHLHHKQMMSAIMGITSPASRWHTFLGRVTNGPLDTIMQPEVLSKITVKDELLISYCDVIVPIGEVRDFVSECRKDNAEAGMCVFDSDDTRYQRVRTGEACSGLFYFSSGIEFIGRALKEERDEHTGIPKVVIGGDHVLYDITDSGFADIGVPEDYEAWLHE